MRGEDKMTLHPNRRNQGGYLTPSLSKTCCLFVST